MFLVLFDLKIFVIYYVDKIILICYYKCLNACRNEDYAKYLLI